MVADVAREYLRTFVSASATTKYAALSTSGGQRCSSSTVIDRHGDRRTAGERADGDREPLHREDLRMEPARELAKLLVRGVQLDERPLEVLLRLRRDRVRSERRREVDGVRDADEVLLRAVVEVPLEPLPLGVARRDDARARAPDLLLDLLARRDVETAEEVAQPRPRRRARRSPSSRRRAAPRRARRARTRRRPVGRPRRSRRKSSWARGTSSPAMKSSQNGRPIHVSSGMPDARSSARLTPSSVPLSVHEREEARRGADDGVAEVPLALELARLAALRP